MEGQLKREAAATLRLTHFYAAPPGAVFQAWTCPQALTQWWCPTGWHPGTMEVDLRDGGRYRFSMHDSAGRQIAAMGNFLAIRRPTLLVYTWQWEGVFERMPVTTVQVAFRSVPGGTELELSQGRLELPDCCRHLHGWIEAFDRLWDVIGHRRSPAEPTIENDASRAVS